MRTIFIIFLILSITTLVYAEKWYVILDKVGKGSSEKGDVIAIVKEVRLTRAEKQRYLVKIMDLTTEERSNLLEHEKEKDNKSLPDTPNEHLSQEAIDSNYIYHKERKRKFDLKDFNSTQKEELTRNETVAILQKVTDKPSSIISSP